eukprot:g20113.t1
MKVGLPTRITYGELENSLGPLVTEGRALFANETPEVFMGSLLYALDIPDEAYELGKTRIFFRAGQLDTVDRILSSDFEEDKPVIMERLRSALEQRKQAKALVDGLSRALIAAGSQFDTNRAQIEALEVEIDAATGKSATLTQVVEPMKEAVDRVMDALSNAQTAVDDVKVNSSDIASGMPTEYEPIGKLIDEASAQLKVADELWKEVDEKANLVEV